MIRTIPEHWNFLSSYPERTRAVLSPRSSREVIERLIDVDYPKAIAELIVAYLPIVACDFCLGLCMSPDPFGHVHGLCASPDLAYVVSACNEHSDRRSGEMRQMRFFSVSSLLYLQTSGHDVLLLLKRRNSWKQFERNETVSRRRYDLDWDMEICCPITQCSCCHQVLPVSYFPPEFWKNSWQIFFPQREDQISLSNEMDKWWRGKSNCVHCPRCNPGLELVESWKRSYKCTHKVERQTFYWKV